MSVGTMQLRRDQGLLVRNAQAFFRRRVLACYAWLSEAQFD